MQPRSSSPCFNFWSPYWAEIKKWWKLAWRMYKVKQACDQENEEDGSHRSKIEQRVIQWDLSPKRMQISQKQKTRKRRRTSSSPQSSFPSRRRKKRSKKQNKKKRRRRSPSWSFFSPSSHSSSTGSEEEDQQTKGFHIYRRKINLNGTSRLSLHLKQTHSLKNTSQKKAFSTQSVRSIEEEK